MTIPKEQIKSLLTIHFGEGVPDKLEIHLVYRLESDRYYFLVFFEDSHSKRNQLVILEGEPLIITQNAETRLAPSLPKPLVEGSESRLVWKSSVISRSPYYPFWEIRNRDDVYYIDSNNQVYRNMESKWTGDRY